MHKAPDLGWDEQGAAQLGALVSVTRSLHARGWTPATSSNFSVREGDGFVVSASGLDKGRLTEADFLRVDAAGRPVPGEARRPSAETGLHTVVYAARPEVGCVLHTHSVGSTVLSLVARERGALRLAGFELLKALEGTTTHEAALEVPVFDNTQEIPALAAEVALWLADEAAEGRRPWGFLIAGHGLYVWGTTPEQALRHAEAFEFLFECVRELRRLGVHERIAEETARRTSDAAGLSEGLGASARSANGEVGW